MTKRAFEQMMAGMEDAIAFANGDPTRGRVAIPSQELDVAAIRKRTGKGSHGLSACRSGPCETGNRD